jgi:hypothetical protein
MLRPSVRRFGDGQIGDVSECWAESTKDPIHLQKKAAITSYVRKRSRQRHPAVAQKYSRLPKSTSEVASV